ncbi:hypothetical protein OYC37_14260 [Escherichia coli]|nr:hypothetical protein [Escherichia coli]MCY6731234.1 hypothetical protein [Escherichia coli]MCY6748886.1 hypothetical protein [Escherichia coli]
MSGWHNPITIQGCLLLLQKARWFSSLVCLIDSTGKIAKYEGDPMIVEFHPATTMPITVRNQGKDYPPPTEHLGEKLVDIHPSVLAYLGIQFYEKWIDESCATFR